MDQNPAASLPVPPAEANEESHGKHGVLGLAIGAVGVVYGDIGTSPLYAMKESFGGTHNSPVIHDNVVGVLSLMSWSLILIVTLKYVVLIMRADNRGEGGIMALTALVRRSVDGDPRRRQFLLGLGMFGAALFYGDGMITPAISVLSAVEGLEVVDSGSEVLRDPDHPAGDDRPVRGAADRHGPRRRLLRPDHGGLVRGAGRAGRGQPVAVSQRAGGAEPVLGRDASSSPTAASDFWCWARWCWL